jgi:pimeloyl-ACP methyl ester carboxylesterase
VVPGIAGLTTVVTYDRPGYGESELGDAPTDGKRTVQDLHTLLQKLNIPGPYILVGHSYGGKLVRLFASAYPKDMAGLILEDTGHEDMKDAIRGLLSGPERDRFVAASSRRPSATGGPGAEAAVLELTHQQLRESRPLPQIPLTVLTAGSWPVQPIFTGKTAEKVRALRLEFQKKLAGMIPGSRHVTVEGAGHNIHLDRPKALVEAIETIVKEVRQRER